ncbi:MAG: membrane integrity-associated transporter subunit PqiC [Desulfobacterales bacterium]|nr:membrane integrity-associated transporter subunit PqiC [Desulfobacterales bacterium]
MIPSKSRLLFTLIIFLVGMAGLAGCTGKSPKSDFYALGATPAPGPTAALSQEIAIAVGPVTIPAELDRQQIVTRDTDNRISVAELSRWVGPLQDNITSVLTANLATRLGTEKVAPHNRESLFPFTHHVVLNFNRFDGHPQSDVLLDVTWSIKKSGVSAPLIVQHTEIREPVASADYAGLVGAQSKALAEISTRIAEAFKQLAR